MKVTFISNYLDHHQLPFSKDMINTLGNEYTFIATKPIEDERIKLGYPDINHSYDFVLCSYDNDIEKKRAMELIMKSDVVIQGGSDTSWIQERLKEKGKLTFRYIERLFKTGYIHLADPRVIRNCYYQHTRYNRSKFYLLAAGGYVARDCQIIHAYSDKMLKWGYFPETFKYDDIDDLLDRKRKHKTIIMWAGRFIDWKHSECAIQVAQRLYKKGYKFELRMVGTGPLLNNMEKYVQKLGLSNQIMFLGPLTPDLVRKNMEEAAIYLFTSDYQEGWGAVLNESMNSACAVVVSHAIGAVPFLIKDGQNGLIYRSGSLNELYSKVETLIDNPNLCRRLSINAYKEIVNTWNSNVATDRFLKVCNALLCENNIPNFADGPCSVAVPIPQNKQYNLLKRGLNK